jgi:uroporphyrinogen-III decarboxylase
MEIIWSADQPPKVRHPLTAPGQIDDLEVPDPAGGANAKLIEWYQVMTAAARDFAVTLNGVRVGLKVTLDPAGGPMPSAFALAGENLFLWMADQPERVQRLMMIVTTSYLRCIRYFDELTGRDSHHDVLLGADGAEMLSPAMFERFVVPGYQLIWETYGGRRSYHSCGRNGHLLELMRDALRIDELAGFGSCVDPALLAEKLGGRVVLSGGPSPTLILTGPPGAIHANCRHYINVLGRHSGYILDIGNGPAPGTPLAHYEAMIEAAKSAGIPGYRQGRYMQG